MSAIFMMGGTQLHKPVRGLITSKCRVGRLFPTALDVARYTQELVARTVVLDHCPPSTPACLSATPSLSRKDSGISIRTKTHLGCL